MSASVVIVVMSSSYTTCAEFHWEMRLMQTRVQDDPNQLTVLPIGYELVGFPSQYATKTSRFYCTSAPHFRIPLPDGNVDEKVTAAIKGLTTILWVLGFQICNTIQLVRS